MGGGGLYSFGKEGLFTLLDNTYLAAGYIGKYIHNHVFRLSTGGVTLPNISPMYYGIRGIRV